MPNEPKILFSTIMHGIKAIILFQHKGP